MRRWGAVLACAPRHSLGHFFNFVRSACFAARCAARIPLCVYWVPPSPTSAPNSMGNQIDLRSCFGGPAKAQESCGSPLCARNLEVGCKRKLQNWDHPALVSIMEPPFANPTFVEALGVATPIRSHSILYDITLHITLHVILHHITYYITSCHIRLYCIIYSTKIYYNMIL